MYYTYAYIRKNKTPYYIGKGTGNRAYVSHIRSNGQNLTPRDKSRILILKYFSEEESAYNHEKYLTFLYGLKKDGGLLVNMIYGGGGSTKYLTKSEKLEACKNSKKKHYEEKQKSWRKENRNEFNQQTTERNKKRRDEINEIAKKWRNNNKEKSLESVRKCRNKNKEEYNRRAREKYWERKKSLDSKE